MKTCFLGVFLCIASISLHAQVPKSEDSLRVFLKTHPKDTLYIWAIRPYAVIQIYEKADLKKADSLAIVQKTLSEKLNYGRGIYFSYLIQAIISQQKSEYQKMLENFQKCYEVVLKYKLNKYLQEASLNNISVAYDGLGNQNEAMRYALMAIEVQEKNNLPKMDSAPYGMVGNVLKHNNKYQEALIYYQKSLNISLKKEYFEGIAIDENKIGNLYDDMGNQSEALKHYKIGYTYALKAKYLLLQTDLLSNLGRMELHFKNYSAAEKYLLENEKLCKSLENEQALRTAYSDLGNLYQTLKKYSLAEKYFLSAKTTFKENTNPKLNQEVSENLSEFYAETQNYKKAYSFLVDANISRDSAFKIESQELTQNLLAKYETEKKETQIKLLQKEAKLSGLQNKATLGGSAMIFLLLLISGAFLYNQNKLKQLEETQKLRNKISADLHDEIGSTLSSISLLSGMTEQHLQQNQPEIAGKMMQKIYADSHQIMESMDDIIWTVNPQNDSLSKILVRLKEFAQPLVESRNIAFDFNSNPDSETLALPMEVRRNLYLIVKEAINNLVKYSESTKASVSFEKDGKNLYVKIQDNGKGFDSQAVTSRNGLKNMQQRAKDMGGEMDVMTKINEGTIIKLIVKLKA